MADFGVTEDGHPDEVVLPGHGFTNPLEKPHVLSSGSGSEASKASTNNISGQGKPMQPPPRSNLTRSGSNGYGPNRHQPHTPNQQPNRSGAPYQGRPNIQQAGRPNQPGGVPAPGQVSAVQQAASNGRTNTPPPPNGEQPAGPVTFFSARSVQALPEDAPPGTAAVVQTGAKLFDPHFESPSIRKTPGIDHRTSKPVARNGQHVEPTKREEEPPLRPAGGISNGPSAGPTNGPLRSSPGNVVNPSLNHTRQIGAPGGHSPMGNRGAYKPLTVKRPADGGPRPPLNEVSTNGSTASAAGAGNDPKRQKMG
jgi:DNA repair and recombination protein RAD52